MHGHPSPSPTCAALGCPGNSRPGWIDPLVLARPPGQRTRCPGFFISLQMIVTRELPSCAGRSDLYYQGCTFARSAWIDCSSSKSLPAARIHQWCPHHHLLSPARDGGSPIPVARSRTAHERRNRDTVPFESVKSSQASESIDRKNSSLAATASAASCVQQDALPYRVEVRLSHSATLCNPLQPSPPLDYSPLHRLACPDYYCVRTNSPCQWLRRRAPQMGRTVVTPLRPSSCCDPSHISSHGYETPWAGWLCASARRWKSNPHAR